MSVTSAVGTEGDVSSPQNKSNLHATTSSNNAHAWLSVIADSVSDAIISQDMNGIVTSWNTAAETMFGYAAHQVIGRPITVIRPPEQSDEESAILDRVRGGERLVGFETIRQRKDGTRVPVSLTISPVHDEAGRLLGIAKVVRDLSAAMHAQQELQSRQALLRSILDTVPDALIVTNEHGVIESFSATAERLFGFHAADVVGGNVSVLMPSPYREEHDQYVARYRATGERHIIGKGRVAVGQRKDGSTFPIELAIGEVTLPGTRLFTGFVRDLTERRDRERRLNELQSELVHVARLSELGQMVSTLAHEVTQPLTATANYLNAARRLLASDNALGAQEAMARIAQQTDRARQIVRRLRDLVRKGQTEKRLENLPKAIEEASALALIGVGKDLKLDIRVDDDATEAFIDKIQIQQVLLNLMRNAVEAMAGAPRRELSVLAAPAGDMVELRVTDTGPGLPEAVRARLFQPFVTTKPNGIGVGLSVCRTIVEAHGGDLRAEDGRGGGTVFRLTVPRRGPTAPSSRAG
jgi:two-component system sensor kinase FixL